MLLCTFHIWYTRYVVRITATMNILFILFIFSLTQYMYMYTRDLDISANSTIDVYQRVLQFNLRLATDCGP